MFTDSQLEILDGILTRRQDPTVTSQDYDDLTHMVRQERSLRKTAQRKRQEHRARRASVAAPDVPRPFNDPVDW